MAPQLAALKEKAGISDVNADLVAALFKARLDDPAATVRVEEGAGDIESRARFFKGALCLQFLELRSRKFLELAKAATGADRLNWLRKVKGLNTARSAATRAMASALLIMLDPSLSWQQRLQFAIEDPLM